MHLDQYYTIKTTAQYCLTLLADYFNNDALCIEPSAGTGSFLKLLPEGSIGIDIDPQGEGIIEADFLQMNFDADQDLIFVGNPPFGKNASLAVAFFNHAAQFAQIIAFIVPRTFRKASIRNRLNRYFHLVEEADLPPFSFRADGKPYDVPCVFQIWEKRNSLRSKIITRSQHPDFAFVKYHEGDFAIQRVGVNAGRVKDVQGVSPSSHYFIVGDEKVRRTMEKIDFSEVKYNTAGNPSISKDEIITLYEKYKSK